MEPMYFLGQPMRGIVGVLCSFKDEHYPSNSLNPWCLITKYFNEGIHFLVSYEIPLQMLKRYVMEPNVFLGYLEK